jgi:hypothetical protein
MTAARCSCGFRELADEEIVDHLHLVFEPGDQKGTDGQVHEERASLTCACGLSAITTDGLDAYFLDIFTPGDRIGRDSHKHEPTEGTHGV